MKVESADETNARWATVVERIKSEHVGQGWSHYVFRILRALYKHNESLRNEGGFFFFAISEMYVTHSLMTLRRDLDKQRGENLVSLVSEMKTKAPLLTRDGFLKTWGNPTGHMLTYAEEGFAMWDPVSGSGGRGSDYVNPAVLEADLTKLQSEFEQVRQYAERTRAHRTPTSEKELTITFKEMHSAISGLRDVLAKYYTLLTATSIGSWEPVPQFNVLAPFKFPWLPAGDESWMQILREAEPSDDSDA